MHSSFQHYVFGAEPADNIRWILRQIDRKQIDQILADAVRFESEQEDIEITIADKIDALIVSPFLVGRPWTPVCFVACPSDCESEPAGIFTQRQPI